LISDKPQTAFSFAISPQNEVLAATSKGVRIVDQEALKEGRINLIVASQLNAVNKLPVSYLYFDRQKNLWLITNKGIHRMDPHGNHLMLGIKNGLPVTVFYSRIFQDRENTM